MNVLTADRPMAKRNDVSVRIDSEAVKVAKIVAAYRDISLVEYISQVLLATASADLAVEQTKNPVPPTEQKKPTPKPLS
jgi:hypothetical protein